MSFLILLTHLSPAIGKADASTACSLDEALSLAAETLILKGKRPDADELVRAVRDAGSAAVGLYAIWISSDDRKPVDIWLRKVRTRTDAPLVCGVARNENGRLVIAEARAGSLATIDRNATRIRGWLLPAFSHPELVISYRNGEILRYPIDRKTLEAGVAFSTAPVRPVHVQLVARGPAGPRPVAERVIPSGENAPPGFSHSNQNRQSVSSSKTFEFDQSLNDVRDDHVLWIRLSRLRKTRGIFDLRRNRLIERVAVRHAQAVCDTGRAFHELEPGDNPEARLAREGVRARIVGETIARSDSPDAAFLALTKSPAHKSTLLDPRFTDAGVGLVSDPSGKSCLVIVLAAWPRFVGR